MERESDKIVRGIGVVTIVFFVLACVTWYQAIVTPGEALDLGQGATPPSRDDWLGWVVVMGVSVWLYLGSKTARVRALWMLFGTAGVVTPLLPHMIEGPARWPELVLASLHTGIFFFAAHLYWFQRYESGAR